jgi:hypothetical protein
MNEQTLKQLEHLFPDTVNIWTGDKFKLLEPANSEFFCINPLKNFNNRTNDNVLETRNFLMEFDDAPLADQEAAISTIEKNGLKVASAVYSGSKSVHLIFSLAETLNVDYRAAWLALATEVLELTNLMADPACKNEARLSRLAGVTRPDTGKPQTLLHLGGFITNAKLNQLIFKHKIKTSKVLTEVTAENPNMSLLDFKFELDRFEHRGLHSKLRGARGWAEPVNMYPILFKLTHWAIDATGVPRETFLQYAQEKIFPHLINKGYPADKLDKAIHNAYNYK